MKQHPRIAIKQACLGYTGRGLATEVLRLSELEMHSGDFVALVGLNGTGKSTLLKSICGLLPPLDGQILLDGESVSGMDLNHLAKKAAIVLTEKIGGFNLTVFDAVAAGQMPYTNAFHRLNEEHLAPINTAMEACGVFAYRHKPLSELSDGQFQKTMIARALAQQTPAILLDEPTAFLDFASKHELFRLLQGLAKNENKCILVSSHDLDLVLAYCNKLLLLHAGSAQLIPTSEAMRNPAFLNIGGGYLKA